MKADDDRIERVFELRRKPNTLSGNPPGSPDDSGQEDRHSDDDGFAEMNETGEGLKMQVSAKPRDDFVELSYEHLGGVGWEILTGIEARTKFSNSELKHEGKSAVSSVPQIVYWLPQRNAFGSDSETTSFWATIASSFVC